MAITPTIIHVQTNLGLVEGVEELGSALIEQDLASGIGATRVRSVEAPAHDPERRHPSGLLNADALVDVAERQAEVVAETLDTGGFPLVLGGDDSILLGSLIALGRRGRYGLVYLDAHYDYHRPVDSPTGQASDSGLYLALSDEPIQLPPLDAMRPLAAGGDCVVIGARDPEEEPLRPRVAASGALLIPLTEVHSLGAAAVAQRAVDHLAAQGLDGYLIHLDADVIDDALMPAVDYRVPGGLNGEELITIVRALLADSRAVALDVAIYNPALDPGRVAAATLTGLLVEALGSAEVSAAPGEPPPADDAHAAEPLTMYGATADLAQLPWHLVEQQLTVAGAYWVCVATAGQPHPRPVWGVWADGALHLSVGSPQLAAALDAGSPTTIHLASDTNVVIVEGAPAGQCSDTALLDAYNTKYEWDYTVAEYGPLITITPSRVLAWRSAGWAGRGGFQQAARWTFRQMDVPVSGSA